MRLGSQKVRFLAGLLLLLAGLEITVTLTYMARWVGIVLMLFGLGILVLTARKKPEEEAEREEKAPVEGEEPEEEEKEKKTLADRLIYTLTIKGKINWLLPALGIGLILFVYSYNIVIRQDQRIGVNDTITILLGLTLLFYNYVPKSFKVERDFVLLFFIFLFLILVVPLTLISLYSGPLQENTNSPVIYHFLAKPTSDMVNFLGVPSEAYLISQSQFVDEGVQLSNGVWIVYREVSSGEWKSVGVGISCTGLYSVSIFISGFIAFILIEYQRLDIRVASLLTLGVFTSWFANILRMTIIVLVGGHYGPEALKWTHANLGIFIFMIWIAIFWGVMFKVLVPVRKEEGDREEVLSTEKEPGDEEEEAEEIPSDEEEPVDDEETQPKEGESDREEPEKELDKGSDEEGENKLENEKAEGTSDWDEPDDNHDRSISF